MAVGGEFGNVGKSETLFKRAKEKIHQFCRSRFNEREAERHSYGESLSLICGVDEVEELR